MQATRVTLSDVAREAGVSSTTASYILNGRAETMRIRKETQERVQAVAARLGYRPDRNARSLRTSSTAAIGVITDYVASGMFSSKMLAGANAAARALDHVLVIGETDGDPAVTRMLLEDMLARRVDGLVYVTRTTLEVALPAELPAHRVVALNCVDPSRPVPAVLPDERAGGRAAAGVLLAAGVAHDVVVVGVDPTPDALAGPLRVAGLRERLSEDGVDVVATLDCDWRVADAHDAVSAHLASGARPRALVCLNDRIAMGAYQALAAHGLRIPDDVAVVSFDGSELAGWLRPQVVSIGLPFVEMGAQAVSLLFADAPPARTLVPMPVHQGGSVTSDPAPGVRLPEPEPGVDGLHA